jgi:hypothetical protein
MKNITCWKFYGFQYFKNLVDVVDTVDGWIASFLVGDAAPAVDMSTGGVGGFVHQVHPVHHVHKTASLKTASQTRCVR